MTWVESFYAKYEQICPCSWARRRAAQERAFQQYLRQRQEQQRQQDDVERANVQRANGVVGQPSVRIIRKHSTDSEGPLRLYADEVLPAWALSFHDRSHPRSQQEQLAQLEDFLQRGTLSEVEYEDARLQILHAPPHTQEMGRDEPNKPSLVRAMSRQSVFHGSPAISNSKRFNFASTCKDLDLAGSNAPAVPRADLDISISHLDREQVPLGDVVFMDSSWQNGDRANLVEAKQNLYKYGNCVGTPVAKLILEKHENFLGETDPLKEGLASGSSCAKQTKHVIKDRPFSASEHEPESYCAYDLTHEDVNDGDAKEPNIENLSSEYHQSCGNEDLPSWQNDNVNIAKQQSSLPKIRTHNSTSDYVCLSFPPSHCETQDPHISSNEEDEVENLQMQ
mmetsp:Transcript_917/g.2137  ORF Transcript_917/g.2137 Transcript_917/m.2137 type:complete len:394 (+) Transcript_917:416-1597(+)